MPGDSELYRQFLSGDSAAYDELLIRHGESLTFYLAARLHDWQDAEDMMIEAFARIMVKKPAIRDGAFKAYLFRTGKNLASRFAFRKRKILPFSPGGPAADYPDGRLPEENWDMVSLIASSGDYRPEEILLDEEKRKAVYRSLDRIAPDCREALWLVYMEDLSYAEAARVMGVSPKKVDNLLFKGKSALRAELEKEGINHV